MLKIRQTIHHTIQAAEDLQTQAQKKAEEAASAIVHHTVDVLETGAALPPVAATLRAASRATQPVLQGFDGVRARATAAASVLSGRTSAAPKTSASPERPIGAILEGEADGHRAYRKAVLDHIVDDARSLRDQGLTRKRLNQAVVKFHEGPAPRGVALFFHGYNAGTEQWAPHFEPTHRAGYDVVALPLPGHGIIDARTGADVPAFTPTLSTHHRWAEFVDEVVALTRPAGTLTPIGLSAGGQLATQLAIRHADLRNEDGQPVVEKLFAANPFFKLIGDYKLGSVPLRLGSLALTNQGAAEMFAYSPSVLHGAIDQVFGAIKVDLRKGPTKLEYGARYGRQNQVLGLVRNGAEVLANTHHLEKLPGGVQFVGTWADNLIDTPSIVTAYEKAGPKARLHLFDHAPHTITHPVENASRCSLAEFSGVLGTFLSPDAPAR